MATLASEGFVRKDPDSHRYRLGLSILTLGGIVKSTLEISREAAPLLGGLTHDLGETSHLAILEGFDTIYKSECSNPVRILTFVGRKNPSYQITASARNTIIDPDRLKMTLQKIRENGYATSQDELLDGVSSITASVRDYTRNVVTAVNIVGPNQRFPKHRLSLHIKKVVECAKNLSRELGYRGNIL